ncbi:TPA: LOW QUALITY PROTEIN: hypothetical protein N0F65_010124, partial [Lagenidium giganteum]
PYPAQQTRTGRSSRVSPERPRHSSVADRGRSLYNLQATDYKSRSTGVPAPKSCLFAQPTSTMAVPLFTPIAPPRLTSIAHAAVAVWRRARDKYNSKVAARCAATGEDIKARTCEKHRGSESPGHMLQASVECTLEALTEERLIQELERILASVMNNTVPDIDELFRRELRMDRMCWPSHDVFPSMRREPAGARSYGGTAAFGTDRGQREKCKLLKGHLQPSYLQDEVEKHQRFMEEASASCEKSRFKLVHEKALEQDRLHAHSQQAIKRSSDASDKREKVRKPVISRAVGGQLISSHHAVDVFLTLQTTAGPVRCQDRKQSIVVETDEDDFIVGSQLIDTLGIDGKRQLEQLATNCAEDDDPVPVDEVRAVGGQETSATDEAVEELVARAITSGLTEEGGAQLCQIVKKYDVWCLTLGNDPAADVAPL